MTKLRFMVVAVIVSCTSVLTSSTFSYRGPQKETNVTKRASGTFEIKLVPQEDKSAEGLGRMTIEKQLKGDFEGSSTGQMLTAISKVEGSAVYVAVERLTGTLQGQQGSFVLHHTGIMNRGTQKLTINVVPDSGTNQLSGITGTMTIRIAAGKHFYDLDYTLPGKQ